MKPPSMMSQRAQHMILSAHERNAKSRTGLRQRYPILLSAQSLGVLLVVDDVVDDAQTRQRSQGQYFQRLGARRPGALDLLRRLTQGCGICGMVYFYFGGMLLYVDTNMIPHALL